VLILQQLLLCRVLILNIVVCGVFHTLLLAVPHTTITITYPTATARLGKPKGDKKTAINSETTLHNYYKGKFHEN
jgi:hypothetical protein